MKKSNIDYDKKENVILAMVVTNGISTSFSTCLTGKQIDELETLIERLIKECIATERGNNGFGSTGV